MAQLVARATFARESNLSRRSVPRPALQLPGFVPFRLNRLAAAVSDHLSEIYRARFALEIPEWRVMATVGPVRGCTAQHIASSTRMHKTRVSRAIANLVTRGLVERAPSAQDRRERQLRLTHSGRRMYQALVPLALQRERELLACLSAAERRAFARSLSVLELFLGLA